MKRVPRPNWLTPFALFVCLLGCAQSSSATTAIAIPDDDLIIGARVIVKGKILSIESSFDEQQGRIFTYVKLKVQEVLKGQITERKIVIKELGGRVGDRISVVYGNPEFALGEQVLMYLDTWKDGSLRTYQMFLGKFSIVKDEKTGHEFAVRSTGDEHVVVLPAHDGQKGAAITDRMEVSAYIAMVNSRLAANVKQSRRFEQTYYSNVPTLASPPGYVSDLESGEIHPEFNLFNPPVRWFEPDTGQPVTYTLNPNPSTEPGVPSLVVDPADIAAAANSWSTVPGCGLHISYAGNLEDCYTFTGTPGINVVSNNCDGRNSPTTGCAGILAWGGYSGSFYSPIVINGTTFQYRITQGFVSCNPWAACNFSDHCSVQFIVTHEMGHALGLGHSQYQQATMYAIAYYIARCAVIWTDDQDAIKFVYPGGGGGPGPLSIVTSSLSNGTVGTAYNQSLSATGATLPYTWSLVAGQGTLPPGLSLATGGSISGTPTTAGTYNFTVKVTDAASATAQKALSIVVAAAGALPFDAQFVSQTVPASVTPGQAFSVNIKFQNIGTQTWTGFGLYWLASQNPALNQTWGGNGVPMDNFVPIAPGQQLDVTFQATAPFTSGVHNFQWQMYKDDGTAFFGQMSTNVPILVGSAATKTLFDFDADGKTDVAIYRPLNGNWYSIDSSSGTLTVQQFGSPGDQPIPADYDGDGKTDIAVYRPSTGFWYIMKTSGGFTTQQFGSPGDQPFPADYDGDGKADIAVYRPSTGFWYIMKSSGGYTVQQFGSPGDIPVPADYDGDGKADIAVYRPSTGFWYIMNSGVFGSYTVQQFGSPGDQAIAADYDGDGKADIAVYRPSTGFWYIMNSGVFGSYTVQQFGSPGDKPLPADYDGDGKVDIAVYRPSTGFWYIINSGAFGSYTVKQFGATGDVAVPSVYIQ